MKKRNSKKIEVGVMHLWRLSRLALGLMNHARTCFNVEIICSPLLSVNHDLLAFHHDRRVACCNICIIVLFSLSLGWFTAAHGSAKVWLRCNWACYTMSSRKSGKVNTMCWPRCCERVMLCQKEEIIYNRWAGRGKNEKWIEFDGDSESSSKNIPKPLSHT